MRAAIYSVYGPPEVVDIREVEIPVPGKHEVLVKVYASTVNRTDCGFRSAEYFISRFYSGLFKPKNHTLGNEFAGVVEAIGPGVATLSVGDRVFGYNDITFGAHAEYMLVSEYGAITIMPDTLTYGEAAPICEGGHYALCDIRAANVSKDHHVLVYGATGAIGSAAVQLLKHIGAHVTAVCNTGHVELIKSLGADGIIDYSLHDFTDTEQTFDFIFDAVGKSSFARCKKILTKTGIYMSTELGKHSVNILLALITPLFGGKKVLFPIPTTSKKDVIYLKELVEAGSYKPLIDRYYPLERIVDAYRYVETGQKTGNVVLTMTD